MSTETLSCDPAAMWGRVIQFEEELSPAGARALLKIRFSHRALKQMEELSAKARQAALTPQEQVDLDNYERLGCLLDILHSKARLALKPRRANS